MNPVKEINRSYYSSLDVVRFIAVFVSFLVHSKVLHFYHGHTFFFVLTGFILTTLAEKEYALNNNFSLLNFTVRRALRILPLYILLLIIGFIIIPFLSDTQVILPDSVYYLTLTSNYCYVPHIFVLSVLWAVSVQEQFYFFISIFYKFFYRHLVWVALGMILISISFKYFGYNNHREIYFHTLNHFSSFGSGILLAISIRENWLKKLVSIHRIINFLIYGFIAIVFYFSNYFNGFSFWNYIDNVVISICFCYIIFEQCFMEHKIIRLDNIKLLPYLGRISYGLYCYQGLIITLGALLNNRFIIGADNNFQIVINFTMLLIVSHFSYQWFEKRFLIMKRNFRTYPDGEIKLLPLNTSDKKL